MKSTILSVLFLFAMVTSLFAADTIGTAQIGTKVTFTCTVGGGTPPFTYQWKKDGTAISGATASALVFPAIAATDAGAYTVVVANPAGNATSNNAVFTVTLAPPSSVTITISNG